MRWAEPLADSGGLGCQSTLGMMVCALQWAQRIGHHPIFLKLAWKIEFCACHAPPLSNTS